MRKAYKTDLTDAQWALVEPLIPPAKPGGREREVDMREVLNTLNYQQRTGVQWDLLPHDLVPKSTAYDYYSAWQKDGTWQKMVDALREKVRVAAGREPTPSAGSIDSQSVKTAGSGGPERGHDAAKKVTGRKRNIAVDTMGMLLAVSVTAASADDARAAQGVLRQLTPAKFPRLELLWADCKYHNHALNDWMASRGVPYRIDVVSRPPDTKGWVPLAKRWVVERTFAWIGRDRRNSKDYERDPKSSECRVQLSAIGTMLRRLCPNTQSKDPEFRFRAESP